MCLFCVLMSQSATFSQVGMEPQLSGYLLVRGLNMSHSRRHGTAAGMVHRTFLPQLLTLSM